MTPKKKKKQLSPQERSIKLQQMTAEEHANQLLILDESMKKHGVPIIERALFFRALIHQLKVKGADIGDVYVGYHKSGLADEYDPVLDEINGAEWELGSELHS